MSWTASEFLDLLEHRGIMSADHVDHLRDQVAAAGCDFHPVLVARKLVEAGYLNPYFAKTLLEEGYRQRGPAALPPARGSRAADEELDLAPLEEELRAEAAALAQGSPSSLSIDLPPMHDPDAWPSASELGHALPPAKLIKPHGSRNQFLGPTPTRQRPADLPWLLWSLGGAVAVLVLIVLMLLIAR